MQIEEISDKDQDDNKQTPASGSTQAVVTIQSSAAPLPPSASDSNDDRGDTDLFLTQQSALRRSSQGTDQSSLPRQNPAIYNLVYLTVYWVKLSQLFLILFNRKLVAKGLASILSGYDITNIPLPENYGEIQIFAPPLLEIPADLLAVALLLNNLSAIDAEILAKRYAENLEEGFTVAMQRFFDEGNEHRLLKAVTTGAMLIQFAGLSWREIEPNFDQLQEHPLLLFIFASIFFSSNMFALIFLSSRDVSRGLSHLLNRHPVLLAPPQAYFWTLLKQGRWATAFQIFAESQTEHVTNAFLTAFLCGRIVQQFTWLPIPTSVAKWIGATCGYYISTLVRGPVVYAKYNGALSQPFAAVTTEDRCIVKAEKDKLHPDSLANEVKCFFLGGLDTLSAGSITGYAQTILGSYLAYSVTQKLQNTPLTILLIAVSGLLSYLPYRCAQRELTLNGDALGDVAIRTKIFTRLKDATNAEIEKLEAEGTTEEKGRLLPRLLRRKEFIENQLSACLQRTIAPRESLPLPNPLYPDEEIPTTSLKQRPLATASVGADTKQVTPAAPPKIQPTPTSTTGWVASLISGLASVANATIGVSVFLHGSLRTNLSRSEGLVLASAANMSANVVSYRYTQPKVAETLDNSVCFRESDELDSTPRRSSFCCRLFGGRSRPQTPAGENSALNPSQGRPSYGSSNA